MRRLGVKDKMGQVWRFHCDSCGRSGPWGKQRSAWQLGTGHIELFHPVVARMDKAPAF